MRDYFLSIGLNCAFNCIVKDGKATALGGYRASGIEYHTYASQGARYLTVCVIVRAFMVYRFNLVKPNCKVHYSTLKSPTNSSNACHTPLFDDHITCLEFKRLGVVLGVMWQGYRSLGGGCQFVRFEAYFACFACYGRHAALVAGLGSCFAA